MFDELKEVDKTGETEHMSTKNQSMITPLIELDVKSEKQPDIRVKPFTFESTEVEIDAVTEIGKTLFASMFGQGAVSVTMKKSTLFDFEKFANQRGVLVA